MAIHYSHSLLDSYKNIFSTEVKTMKKMCAKLRAHHNNPLQEKNVLPLTKKQEKKIQKTQPNMQTRIQ